MNKIFKIIIGLVFVGIVAVSCNDMLDVDSDQIVLAENHQLDNFNDTIYSMVGIYNKLQVLSDRYVLLGELRGDLMDLTSGASNDLKEIYNFDMSKENQYNQLSDYYDVINSCNYIIHNSDTSLVDNFEKVMYREYAQAKAIRAWTYMQVALNYDTVTYYDKPILDVVDANKSYPKYTIVELAPVLISDLESVQDVMEPGISSGGLGFNVKYLIGDLYLWAGDYENAAIKFYELIDIEFTDKFYEQKYYYLRWSVENGVFTDWYSYNWFGVFGTNAQLTEIITPIKNGVGNSLDSLLFYYPEVQPSDIAVNNWESQTYYHNNVLSKSGDFRGDGVSYINEENYAFSTSTMNDVDPSNTKNGLISKYYIMNSGNEVKAISLARDVDIYLKYAEAINRLGKPNMAFAVLKYGLNTESIEDHNIIPTWEKYSSYEMGVDSVFYPYTDFSDPEKYEVSISTTTGLRSDGFVGIHARGCGNMHLIDSYQIKDLPENPTLDDSIKAVEDMIIEEYALEKAFEGNRFQDLMRICKHRGDNTFLAEKVSAKYDNADEMKVKLMDENNWYMPIK